MIEKVWVFGGTHGNEWTGSYLVRHLCYNSEDFEIEYCLSNPEAFYHNRRYIEKDLNRCFIPSDLEKNVHTSSYEENRAKELVKRLNNKGFIIDLHTTTSEMGPTLILTREDLMSFQVVRFVKESLPEIKVIKEVLPVEQSPFLASKDLGGVIVEVGPCAQGLLTEKVYEQTKSIVLALFEGIKYYNEGKLPPKSDPIEVFEVIGREDYPRDKSGELTGLIDQRFQGRNFEKLKENDPIFRLFDGSQVSYSGKECYPIFINEAAYYEKGVAFVKTQKLMI
jgi:aspartoacylase